MKTVITFVLVLLCATGGFAQTADLENLLDIHRRNEPQPTIYNGQPFVHIDEPVPEPVPTEPQPEPTLSPYQLPEYKIKTPFGQHTTAAFVDHTTDFSTIVQIIDQDTVLMEERIQFVTTKPTTFKRELPLLLSNIKNTKPLTITLMNAQKNGKPILLNTTQTADKFIMTDNTPLQTGVHSYVLRYTVQGNLYQKDGSTRLTVSLTGTDWPYPVERFSTLVLFPGKTSVFEKSLLFGTNNVAIKDSFDAQTDAKGNTSFRLTRPLPEYADVKIILFFDGSILPSSMDAAFSQRFPTWFVFSLILGAQIIYIVLSALFFKVKKNETKPLKFLTSWPLTVLRRATGHSISTDWLEMQTGYAKQTKRFQRGTRLIQFCYNHVFLRPLIAMGAIVFVAFKYSVTQFILIGALGIFAAQNDIHLTLGQYGLLIIAALALTVLIVRWGAFPHLRRNIHAAEKMLLKPDFGFGLSKQATKTLFLQYYPYLLAIGKEDVWHQNQKKYNPDIAKMTFKKEGK